MIFGGMKKRFLCQQVHQHASTFWRHWQGRMQAVQYLGPNQEFSLNSAAPKPSPVSERPSILAHFSCNQEDFAR